MMTTWQDYLLHKSHTHTWMVYVPLLARELDYPEILGLRVPLPTLVQNNRQDPLVVMGSSPPSGLFPAAFGYVNY